MTISSYHPALVLAMLHRFAPSACWEGCVYSLCTLTEAGRCVGIVLILEKTFGGITTLYKPSSPFFSAMIEETIHRMGESCFQQGGLFWGMRSCNSGLWCRIVEV